MATNLTEKLKEFPEAKSGKHLLYWLSLAAVSFAVISTLKTLAK